MARLASLILSGLAGAASLLGGCNAVLGIDEAQLLEPAGPQGPGSRPGVIPITSCQLPTSSCERCLAQGDCEAPKQLCLENRACRTGLNNHRVCLTSGCTDPDNKCFDGLKQVEASSGFPSERTFTGCVSELCSADCAGSPLASPCDLYCGCMLSNCGISDRNECLAACAGLSVATVLCRLTHCNAAPDDPLGNHCGHAVGETHCTGAVSVVPGCTDRNQDSSFCTSDDDCCSRVCRNNACERVN